MLILGCFKIKGQLKCMGGGWLGVVEGVSEASGISVTAPSPGSPAEEARGVLHLRD